MKLEKLITPKGIMFLALFTLLVFVGDRLNFSKLIGAENQFFTLFQFFGPIAGAFLGPFVGVSAVLIAEVSSKLVSHQAFTLITVLRLLPMLFAAWYFGTKKDKLSIAIPLICIALFVAHPVGLSVWYFSLFWTIPIIVKLLPVKYSGNPFLKGLGATFTAHAVGGAMWNYIVPMTSQSWNVLIPIVIRERLLFALGIGVTYIVINTLLHWLDEKTKAEYVHVEPEYALVKTNNIE